MPASSGAQPNSVEAITGCAACGRSLRRADAALCAGPTGSRWLCLDCLLAPESAAWRQTSPEQRSGPTRTHKEDKT